MSNDIDIGQITEALNDKMDRDGVNASCPVVISRTPNNQGGVVEIWSDGYCVQSGIINNSSPSNVVLDTNYIDSSYNVEATTYDHTGANTGCWTVVKDKTVSGFKIYGYYASPTLSTNTAYDFLWEAKGYIR